MIDKQDGAAVSRRQMLSMLGASGAALVAGCSVTDAISPRGATSATPGGDSQRASSLSLDTRLTREYGARYPFVGAGMGFVSMPPLVAAVTNAGGIGVLGNAIEPPPSTQLLIQSIKAATTGLFGVDLMFDESAFGPLTTDAHIDVCVGEGVKLVVFHQNVPPKAWVDRLHQAGARVWMQCGSVQQATDAAAIGIDAVIAQGSQAGGHNKSVTKTLKLLPQIIDAVQPLIVLAAGGIADGDSVVAALAKGADGVWVGTRLVASTEAYAHPELQRRILEAGEDSSVITTMFGPEYPGRTYRVLRNRIVNQFAGKEDQIPNPPPPPAVIGSTLLFPFTFQQPYEMPKFSAIVPTPDTTGDFEEMGLPAGGESASMIDDIKPAGEIIAEMMSEAQRIISRGTVAS